MKTSPESPHLIGLYKDQVKRIRRKKGDGSAIIRSAIIRFEAGEIHIQKTANRKKAQIVYISMRNRPTYTDAEIRGILDAHFRAKMFRKEIKAADAAIAEMLRQYSGVEYIAERPQE